MTTPKWTTTAVPPEPTPPPEKEQTLQLTSGDVVWLKPWFGGNYRVSASCSCCDLKAADIESVKPEAIRRTIAGLEQMASELRAFIANDNDEETRT
jgi:hypothetical protein